MARSIALHRFETFFGSGALTLISRTAVVQIAYVAIYLKTVARVIGLASPDKLMRCGTTAYDVALRIHRMWLVFVVFTQVFVCLAQTFDLLGTGAGKTLDKFVEICRRRGESVWGWSWIPLTVSEVLKKPAEMRYHIFPHFIGFVEWVHSPGVYDVLKAFEKAPKVRNLFWKISNVGVLQSCNDRRQVASFNELNGLTVPVTAVTRHVVRST